ncbi:MAG: beta-propeller fold lactonase family protein, partial [Bacteroidota bacterium]
MLAIQCTFAQSPYTPGKIAVLVVGDGSAALSANATPLFIKEFNLTGGSQTGTVRTTLPVTATTGTGSVARALTQSGSSTSEGLLNLSGNGQYLLVTGYNSTTGSGGVSTSSSTTFPTNTRVVGRVDATGAVNTTTTFNTGYSGVAVRAAASVDGSAYWSSGANAIDYVTNGNIAAPVTLSSTNTRSIGIFNNQLYASSQSGSLRLVTVGTGLPTSSSQTVTNLNGLLTTTGDPYGFTFIDINGGGPDVVYVASLTTAPIGLLKYTSTDNGATWTANGSLSGNVFSVTGIYNTCTGNVDLYITSNTSNAKPNALYKFSDLAVNAASPAVITNNGSALNTVGTLLATAAANTAFGGVAFTPASSLSAPALFTLTGSNGCTFPGVTIGLSGSTSGINYQLFSSGVGGAVLAGTGSALNFGNVTTAGTDSIVATNPLTGCKATMTGNIVITLSPIANSIGNQTLCAGSNTTTTAFTTSNLPGTFTWTNNNTAIGLAASGTGNIPSFATTAVVGTATISVTPVFTGYAYIPSRLDNKLYVIDRSTNLISTSINVGTDPFGASVSPDGSRVYVANNGSANISVINTSTNAVVATVATGSGPVSTAVSPDGSRVYVANTTGTSFSIINAATNTFISNVTVGSSPYQILVNKTGTKVYVANSNSNSVSVYDVAGSTVVATITVGTLPRCLAFSADGSLLYVTNRNTGSISIINTTTNAVTSTITVGSPIGIVLSGDGSNIYAANSAANTVSVISTATNTITNVINVGTNPAGIAIGPDGNYIYVTNVNSNSVSVIDVLTNTVVSTVASVGSSPVAIGNSVSGTGCTGTPVTFTYTTTTPPTWYKDADNDLYGDGTTQLACTQPAD